MSKYENGLVYLAKRLKQDDQTVILLGGSAAYVESDLAAIGVFPDLVKSPPRQSLTDYVEDVKKIANEKEGNIIIVEDHSLNNGKILFLAEHFPEVDIVSIVGKKPVISMENCRVLEIDPVEADLLHKRRSTPSADKR